MRFDPDDDRDAFPVLDIGARYPMRRGGGWVEILARSEPRFGESGRHYTVETSDGSRWDRWDWALLNMVDPFRRLDLEEKQTSFDFGG